MTTVPAVASTSNVDAITKAGASTLDYNAFLKLLIAQLKNQDPTAPTDSTQFVAQLATFSQVEQSVSANTKLDSLLTSSALSLADQVIGRNVVSADGSVSGRVASVKISSDGTVATLTNGSTVTLGSGVTIGQ